VIAGLVLIAVGLAILWSARDAGEVNADVARWQAGRTKSARLRRALQFSARVSPAASVWYGRAIALLAFVGGVILIVRG
jgi:hypothetical protein